MPEGVIEQRLGRIEDRLSELVATVSSMAVRVEDLNGDVSAVVAEVGGAPETTVRGPRESLRWRVHNLENDRTAAQAAHAALRAAAASRAQAWSRTEKGVLFLFAALAAANGVLRIFGIGG